MTDVTVETAEAPPAADKARLFRGSGTIGEYEVSGNRHAATVLGYLKGGSSPLFETELRNGVISTLVKRVAAQDTFERQPAAF